MIDGSAPGQQVYASGGPISRMNVLIPGGTGFIGRHLSRELLRRGHEVTAVSRDPNPADVPDAVETATADVTEYDELPAVVSGQDAVVNLVALSPLYQPKGGSARQEIVAVGGTRNLVRAMESTGVNRLLYQSGLGAHPDAPTAHLRAKGRAEGIVRSSDLDWTITRPSVVFGDGDEIVPFTRTLTTPYLTILPGGGRTPFQPIWIGDLCPMLADILEDDEHIGETYEFGGPEVLTLADITRTVHGARGRSVTIVPLPMAMARIGLAVAGVLPLIPFGRDQYHGLTVDNRPDVNAVSRFGREESDLRTLEDYLS